ncbi:MAG: hypothetical protein R3313_01635 [Candidatus Saccharimonadales bacterium]|nr:hypothetical protein [Candidatus Saccharimonadales bacterium]
MSKFLSELLDAKEPLFSLSLTQLEKSSGAKARDNQLKAKIIERAHLAIKELGLDHQDTTGPELYQALMNKIEAHDAVLAEKIGTTAAASPATISQALKHAIEETEINKQCWVLKRSVAKEILRKTPPKNIMKVLGYRSIDSMIKNENLAEIYGAIRFAEDSDWLTKFNRSYASLTPADFETREIEIVLMPAERWAELSQPFIEQKKHTITHLKELGVILMLPVNTDHLPGMTISTGSFLFHYINEIRLYSAFFKMKQVAENFGDIFVETLLADPDMGPIMGGQNIHWRVIQRYFGKIRDEYHPEIFEPHLQPEDLYWRKAEEALYKIAPELKFWDQLDYVGLLYDGRPISFNMMDVAASYTNKTSYDQREIYHFRESLWNQIFIEYMGEKTLEEQVLRQMDNDMIAPEKLELG